jgi:1-phosphatidylinositol-3-phosphate 5-kinase
MALRHNFHQIEQSLYTLLAKTSDGSLNEARSTFLSTGRGTQKRLSAWQRKHLGPKAKLVGNLVAEEPVWWGKDCHVVPRGNIIVRENDWGSIIAHTLRYSSSS